jgi:hypothetical protein
MFDFIENIGKKRNNKQFSNKIRAYKQKELSRSIKIDIELKLLENHLKKFLVKVNKKIKIISRVI